MCQLRRTQRYKLQLSRIYLRSPSLTRAGLFQLLAGNKSFKLRSSATIHTPKFKKRQLKFTMAALPLSSRAYFDGIYIPAGLLVLGTFIVKKEWTPAAALVAIVLGLIKYFRSCTCIVQYPPIGIKLTILYSA